MSIFEESMGRGRVNQVSFWDIFRNSWKVLWEKPKPLLTILATLAVLSIVFEYMGLYILGPFGSLFDKVLMGQANADEFLSELRKLIEEQGSLPLLLGKLVPWLLAPLINLSLARVALNLWDGYQIGLNDILFSLGKYLVALYVTVLVAIMAVFMFGLTLAAGLPMAVIHSLTFGAGLPGGSFAFLSIFGFAASLFLFIKFVWPILRRYFFLQYLAFFAMAEGESGNWAYKLLLIFRRLNSYGRALHQAILTVLVVFLALNVGLFVLSAMLSAVGAPTPLIKLAAQLVYLIAVAWFIVALSGFYRLCLAPEPETQN
ncbi:MAG: hypothetical protein LBF58_03435 [Deltaproteobacteria bacterium]|jgi:hypothetical protein|nr:hypothetical protein [Deltaproteobacteria bacterium]